MSRLPSIHLFFHSMLQRLSMLQRFVRGSKLGTCPAVVLSGGGSVIDLDGTIVLQLFIFLLCFLVLRALVFRPMLEVFAARQEATEGKSDDSDDMAGRARALESRIEKRLLETKQASASMVDEGRRSAMIAGRAQVEQAQVHLEKRMKAKLSALDGEKESVRKELKSEIGALSRQMAQAVLGKAAK